MTSYSISNVFAIHKGQMFTLILKGVARSFTYNIYEASVGKCDKLNTLLNAHVLCEG